MAVNFTDSPSNGATITAGGRTIRIIALQEYGILLLLLEQE